jgi:hypothetical protein
MPDAEAVPADEIWYVTADGSLYDIYQTTTTYGHQPFDRKIVSNTLKNGVGVIKFDGPVTRINDYTFGNGWAQHLTQLYLPDGIESIGTGAIYITGLKTLRIPACLKHIGDYGLSNHPEMTCFTGSHVSSDGRSVVIGATMYAFAPKDVANYRIPAGVDTVSGFALAYNKQLESVEFPEGVTTIENSAVGHCPALKRVTLPATLVDVHPYAFLNGTAVEGFYGNKQFHTEDNKCLIINNWLCGFAGVGVTEYTLPEGIVGIENYAFAGAKELTRLTLPGTLTQCAGYRAFEGCVNLEAIYGANTSDDHRCIVLGTHLNVLAARKGMPAHYVIPGNVIGIDFQAFAGCSEVESITMSDAVTTIDGYAFASCPNLKSVTLSASLTGIYPNDLNPFFESSNLEAVYCRSVVPPSYHDTQMGTGFPKLKFYVPQQSLQLYKEHFGWGAFATHIEGYRYNDLPEVGHYVSSDFSHDKQVTALQTAGVGKGIDIVLLGDGYSDRQIASGTYHDIMKLAAEKLFSIEPYKSFRNYFNVYSVAAVSLTEGYGNGTTVFGGYFGGGTLVGGNDPTVFAYAREAIGDERMDEALVVVMMNSDVYAGTCYMYYPTTGNYGNGASIAYFPVGDDDTSLEELIHHEANGHGFAKLADEYAYEAMGTMPATEVDNYKQQEQYGWWKNVDFTGDFTTIKWSHLLADSRYAGDKLSAYEGAFTYWSGAWRPTDNSIMTYNTGGFNAPSREAIYYRIHKLAYGDLWHYNYEEFVAYDRINRHAAAATKATPHRPDTSNDYKPLHPPVVKATSWREAVSSV